MKHILIVILLALLPIAASAQGKYLLPEFELSIAQMKNGTLIRERFNYNCETQQVEFIDDDGQLMMMEGAMLIDTLRLGPHRLTPYKGHFIDRQYSSEAFDFYVDYRVRVVDDGKIGAMGLKTHAGVQQVARPYYDQMAQGGQVASHLENYTYVHDNTPLESIDITTTKHYNSYVVEADGKKRGFKDAKSLAKAFPAHAEAFGAYLDGHKVNFSHPDEVLSMLKDVMGSAAAQ